MKTVYFRRRARTPTSFHVKRCTGENTRRVGGAELGRGFTQLKPILAEDDGGGDIVEVRTDQREVVELKEVVVRVAL